MFWLKKYCFPFNLEELCILSCDQMTSRTRSVNPLFTPNAAVGCLNFYLKNFVTIYLVECVPSYLIVFITNIAFFMIILHDVCTKSVTFWLNKQRKLSVIIFLVMGAGKTSLKLFNF